jgi:hypothetical protein
MKSGHNEFPPVEGQLRPKRPLSRLTQLPVWHAFDSLWIHIQSDILDWRADELDGIRSAASERNTTGSNRKL